MEKFSEDTTKLFELINTLDAGSFCVDKKVHQIKAKAKGKKKDITKMLFKVGKTYLAPKGEYTTVLKEIKDADFITRNKAKTNEYFLTEKGMDFADSLE